MHDVGRSSSRGRGYALSLALMAVLLVALATTGVVQRAQLQAQREREVELLWIGAQMRQALASYARATPPAAAAASPLARSPQRLDDLVEDRRGAVTVRHLRKVYADPMTGRTDWMLVEAQGRILGIHSRSERVPVKRSGFGDADRGFAAATTYRDWRFAVDAAAVGVSVGADRPSPPAGGPPPPAPPAAPASPPLPTPAPTPPPPPDRERRERCLREYSAAIGECLNRADSTQCRADARRRLFECVR